MFSGLFRYTLALAIGLTGLLILCVSLAGQAQADESSPVLSLYMSNSGIQLTFGMSDSPEPLVEFTQNTWDSPALFGHPPSLVFNDSPIIFFRSILNTAAPAIRREMQRLQLFTADSKPMQVYVAAAGADAAGKLGLPNSNATRLLSPDQQTSCTRPNMSRTEFFTCFAQLEVLHTLYRSRDTSKVVAKVEQDVNLVAAMASSHAKSLDREVPGRTSLVVHATTISNPYLVRDGKAVGTVGWIPASMDHNGGIFEIGQSYRSHLLNNAEKTTSLAKVIALDPRSANHPSGYQANHERLTKKLNPKGFNNFGRLVGETANSLNRARIEASLNAPVNNDLYKQAIAEALPMVHTARTNFMALATAFYALTENEFNGRAPHVIIVGEESDVLFPTVGDFITHGTAITADTTKLSAIVHPILSRNDTRFSITDKTQQWIGSHTSDLFADVEMVSTAEFSRFQHQAAVQRVSSPAQSPAAP
ncbi:hypothetical protein [Sansalvadorimonas verongulae]|uniref:hypothetical protein n=1 Tax=Sansalvadorimonas verongulae TaxID=2172824 RepID=UPI0012BD4C58|nr:hypothetical protein [Sansalvadorimonas verongulae]MTI13842.1 hypothetical protein [Sansalvadorimonas verongulae]